ncbi:MAG: RluA family pseudouridine synthase [bacterium]
MQSDLRKINIEADIDDTEKRLDVFLADLIPEFSRSRIQQLIKEDNAVTVNGKSLKSSYRIKYGDLIEIIIPELKPLELDAENIPLDIKYEDDDMLVVNKPFGMLTHPTSIDKNGTLVNALLYYCQGKLSGINGVMRPGILHRLDRDTSGLLMIAKNDFAHKVLSEQIKTKTARRSYLTVVLNKVKNDSGTFNHPIDRHPTQRHKMGVVEGGKNSITHWKVIKRYKGYTFVEATLGTGRTHQVRVHFSHNNHPVAGDPLYGGTNINIKLNGQALQAYKLSFYRPSDNKLITIKLKPDEDIKKMLRILQSKEFSEYE